MLPLGLMKGKAVLRSRFVAIFFDGRGEEEEEEDIISFSHTHLTMSTHTHTHNTEEGKKSSFF